MQLELIDLLLEFHFFSLAELALLFFFELSQLYANFLFESLFPFVLDRFLCYECLVEIALVLERYLEETLDLGVHLNRTHGLLELTKCMF